MDRHSARRASSFRFTQLRPDGRRRRSPTVRAAPRRAADVAGQRDPAGRGPGRLHVPGSVRRPRSELRRDAGGRSGDGSPTEGMRQARSPTLDLDSLYGEGPQDPRSAPLYRAGGPFLATGRTDPDAHSARSRTPTCRGGCDLPATGCRPRAGIQGGDRATRATTTTWPSRRPTSRSSASTTASWSTRRTRMRPWASASAGARAIVTRHYQWMVWKDLLPRICDPHVLDDVWRDGRKAIEPGRRARHAGRRCRSSSPSACSASGTRWSAPTYDWNRFVSPTRRRAVRALGTWRRPRRRHAAAEHTRGRLPPPLRLPRRRPARPRSHVRTWRARSTRGRRRSCAACRPARSTRPRRPRSDLERNLAFRNLMRARELASRPGRRWPAFLEHRGVPVAPLERAAAAPRARPDPTHARARAGQAGPARTRRCGSTCCARPSSAASGWPASARGSSPRRSTARSTAAGSRSSTRPAGSRVCPARGSRSRCAHLLLYARETATRRGSRRRTPEGGESAPTARRNSAARATGRTVLPCPLPPPLPIPAGGPATRRSTASSRATSAASAGSPARTGSPPGTSTTSCRRRGSSTSSTAARCASRPRSARGSRPPRAG